MHSFVVRVRPMSSRSLLEKRNLSNIASAFCLMLWHAGNHIVLFGAFGPPDEWIYSGLGWQNRKVRWNLYFYIILKSGHWALDTKPAFSPSACKSASPRTCQASYRWAGFRCWVICTSLYIPEKLKITVFQMQKLKWSNDHGPLWQVSIWLRKNICIYVNVCIYIYIWYQF